MTKLLLVTNTHPPQAILARNTSTDLVATNRGGRSEKTGARDRAGLGVLGADDDDDVDENMTYFDLFLSSGRTFTLSFSPLAPFLPIVFSPAAPIEVGERVAGMDLMIISGAAKRIHPLRRVVGWFLSQHARQ